MTGQTVFLPLMFFSKAWTTISQEWLKAHPAFGQQNGWGIPSAPFVPVFPQITASWEVKTVSNQGIRATRTTCASLEAGEWPRSECCGWSIYQTVKLCAQSTFHGLISSWWPQHKHFYHIYNHDDTVVVTWRAALPTEIRWKVAAFWNTDR